MRFLAANHETLHRHHEDISQEALARTLTALRSGSDIWNLVGFAVTTSDHVAAQTGRRGQRETEVLRRIAEAPPPPPPQTSSPAEPDFSACVKHSVALLTTQQQEAIRLRILKGLAARAVAEIMGISKSRVNALIRTAKKILELVLGQLPLIREFFRPRKPKKGLPIPRVRRQRDESAESVEGSQGLEPVPV